MKAAKKFLGRTFNLTPSIYEDIDQRCVNGQDSSKVARRDFSRFYTLLKTTVTEVLPDFGAGDQAVLANLLQTQGEVNAYSAAAIRMYLQLWVTEELLDVELETKLRELGDTELLSLVDYCECLELPKKKKGKN